MNYLIIPAYQPDLNLVKLVRLVHAKSDLTSSSSTMEVTLTRKLFLTNWKVLRQS